MSQHPELAEEQAYIEHAYECLDRAREQALRLRGLTEVGRGGTHQARYERDVIEETVRNRLAHLEIGDAALGRRHHRVAVACLTAPVLGADPEPADMEGSRS